MSVYKQLLDLGNAKIFPIYGVFKVTVQVQNTLEIFLRSTLYIDFFVGSQISIMDKLKNVLDMDLLDVNAKSRTSKKAALKCVNQIKRKTSNALSRNGTVTMLVDRHE